MSTYFMGNFKVKEQFDNIGMSFLLATTVKMVLLFNFKSYIATILMIIH
jgi:hypothetical protein